MIKIKVVIGIVVFMCFMLIYLLSNSLNSKEQIIPNSFINTKLQSDINCKIAFNNFELADIEVKSIQQFIDLKFNDYECIYTPNGAIIFHMLKDKTDIVLVESINYLRTLENTNPDSTAYINMYSNKELIDKLFNSEFDSMNVFGYTHILEYTNNYIPEDKYKQDILKALQEDTDLLNAYFENGALTEEASNYIKEKMNDNIKYKIISGKSNNSEINIDRICILGLNTSDDSNIELKVILKLNKHQKVYDIDIY